MVQQGQYTGDQGQGQREVIKDNREYGEYHWNEKLTLSLRDWEREVGDRQDELDHLPLTDLHVDPSPCIGAQNDHNISITNLPGRSLTSIGFHH